MSEDKKEKGKKKSAIEQGALMNEIIKRDNKFYSLNDNFHLDVKTRKIVFYFPSSHNSNKAK